MRTSAAIEGSYLFRAARSCCVALLVTACAVILFDAMALRPNGYAARSVANQSASAREEQSDTAGARPSDDIFQSTSDSNPVIPDTEDFGMRKALNAKLLQDSPDQPDLNDWPNIKPASGDSD